MALLRRFVRRNDVKPFRPTQNQTKCKNNNKKVNKITKKIIKILQQNIVEPVEARPDKQDREF